jgi:hypothetical protein
LIGCWQTPVLTTSRRFGGDLLDVAGALDPDVQIVVVERYLRRLCHQTRLLVVSGNRDADARNAAGEWFAKWLRRSRGDRLFVDGDEISLSTATVTLCPWWDGPVSRAELEQFLTQAASRVIGKWIWIHHAPPDHSPASWTGKKFAGDKYLVEWIQRFAPDIVLSGHVHNAPFYPDGSWIDRIGKTWVFNPGRQIGPRPTSIGGDDRRVGVHSKANASAGSRSTAGRSTNRPPPLPMHKDFEHLVDHTQMVMALELLPHIDQIFV